MFSELESPRRFSFEVDVVGFICRESFAFLTSTDDLRFLTRRKYFPGEYTLKSHGRIYTLAAFISSSSSFIICRADSFPSCIVLEANRFKFGTKNAGMVTSEG